MKSIASPLKSLAVTYFVAVITVGCGTDSSTGPDQTQRAPGAESSQVAAPASTGASGFPENPREKPNPTNPADVIAQQVKYLNAGDVKGYMATMDPSRKIYKPTETSIRRTAARYKLAYSLMSTKTLSNDGRLAMVEFKQSTIKLSGPNFRDNILTAVAALRSVNGRWLVYGTKIEDVAYLR